MDKDQEQEKPKCIQCGQPGGRRQVDPYQEELYGTRVVVRLHDRCVRDRCDEI